jgi:hypothetical protein
MPWYIPLGIFAGVLGLLSLREDPRESPGEAAGAKVLRTLEEIRAKKEYPGPPLNASVLMTATTPQGWREGVSGGSQIVGLVVPPGRKRMPTYIYAVVHPEGTVELLTDDVIEWRAGSPEEMIQRFQAW